MINLDSILKRRDITLPTKVCLVKTMVFPIVMYGCKESWAPKNWCFWTVVLEKTLESPLDCKDIQPVHCKGYQSWIFIGRTDAEAEIPILWPPDMKNWLLEKRPWSWERLKVRGEGDNRGWDGWMASPMWWTWVWVRSRSWWWTGKPGVLQSTGLQKGGHDWMTELNWGHLRSALGWILDVSLLKNQSSSVSQCWNTRTIFEGLPLELSSRFKEVTATFGWIHSSWRRQSTTPALMHCDGGSLECLQCAAVYSRCFTVLSHLPTQ